MRCRDAADTARRPALKARRIARWIAALTLAVASTAGASASGDRPRIVSRPEDELLLLALRIERLDLDLTLPCYRGKGGTLVPLGAFAQGLEVGILVNPGYGQAQGFVFDERRRFRLSAAAGLIWLDGVPRPFPADRVEWHRDDLYVDSRLIAEWLRLDLVVDLRASALIVKPREPLPIQERLERETASRRTLVAAAPVVDGERVRAPYRMWGWPASDHTLHGYRQGSRFGSASGFQHSSSATGDLLHLEGHGFMAGDDRNPVRDARLSLGRRDPDPVLLGPLGAREVMAGDLVDPGLEMVSFASAGKGALVSSFPLHEETEYDRRTLQGDLPPGWDVELYRNDVLIGYRQAGAGARYEFTDVPLLYGLNHFRLKLYGPQGQIRTEDRIVHLGRSLTPPGQTYYRAMTHRRADQTLRGVAEFSTGLTRQVSLTTRMGGVEGADDERFYEGVGLRFGWDRLFVKTDAVFDNGPGGALQAALATRVGPLGLWAQQAWLNEFQSEVFRPVFGRILDRSAVRLDTEVRRAGWPRLPTSLEWRHDRLAPGSVHDLVHQVSVAWRGMGLSNRFQGRYVRLEGASPPVERRGLLLIHRSQRGLNLRGGVEYGFEHGGELRDLALTAETRKLGPLVSAEIRRSVLTGETSGRLGMTRGYGAFGVALRSDLSSAGGAGVSLMISTSFDRDPHSGRWHLDALPRSQNGSVSARVFLDGNGNGRHDPGEDPIEGVKLRANPGGSEARTGPDGVALLRGFPNGYPSDVGLVTSSLEDPLRIPRREQVAILPRAGSPLAVEFPVVVCGEIAGTVFLGRAGATRPLAGARLELLSERDGSVAKRARSAFDGYYDIAAIAPGRYRLRASAPGPRRNDVPPVEIPIEIGPEGPIYEPVDLTLGGTPQYAGEAPR